jgi:MoaA/NifB/PqqE/SkfB family radical SAM enzyme
LLKEEFMRTTEIVRAWGSILIGRRPSLSIEITRECPLRCPGCYAYEDGHVSGLNLRQLQDKRGSELVNGVLELVDRHRPLHVSLVGGDPLVRFRELNELLPLLEKRGIYVQLVTSAFREIPLEWASIPRLNIVVSIDGLQPEHDARRKPATYDRILRNIRGHRITIHCTITGQMMKRPGYIEEFLEFWKTQSEIWRIWMSMFTPQKNTQAPEILSQPERLEAVQDLLRLRRIYPKLNMTEAAILAFLRPPQSPEQCIFAQTTRNISADLKSEITPCQFGGTPDCSQCGCAASVGLAALGDYHLGMGLTAGHLYLASTAVGRTVSKVRAARQQSLQRVPQPG